ncbi:MAG: hypothetical protein IJ008_04690 [Clostridia bacterium]|nr:hypothetical protein [Clostridia bacterium]
MGLFKSKAEKKLEQKLAIKKTLNSLNKQVNELENTKKSAIEKARVAKENGLTAEYNLALSLYRASVTQQKRAREMLLNFEITTQMKDMASLTKEFLKGLSVLSNEMVKLTNNKDFLKVQQQFEKAITGVETQAQQLDVMMDESEQKFTEVTNDEEAISEEDFAKIIDEVSLQEEMVSGDTASNIDEELKNLRKKIDEI